MSWAGNTVEETGADTESEGIADSGIDIDWYFVAFKRVAMVGLVGDFMVGVLGLAVEPGGGNERCVCARLVLVAAGVVPEDMVTAVSRDLVEVERMRVGSADKSGGAFWGCEAGVLGVDCKGSEVNGERAWDMNTGIPASDVLIVIAMTFLGSPCGITG